MALPLVLRYAGTKDNSPNFEVKECF